jgi:hypothetical protein
MCTKGIPDLPVHPLHHPVTLRVVGSGEDVLDPQPLSCSCELGASVSCDSSRHAETFHPVGDEEIHACAGLQCLHGDSLNPSPMIHMAL